MTKDELTQEELKELGDRTFKLWLDPNTFEPCILFSSSRITEPLKIQQMSN